MRFPEPPKLDETLTWGRCPFKFPKSYCGLEYRILQFLVDGVGGSGVFSGGDGGEGSGDQGRREGG